MSDSVMDTPRPSQLLERVHQQDRVIDRRVKPSEARSAADPFGVGQLTATSIAAVHQIVFGGAGPLGPKREAR